VIDHGYLVIALLLFLVPDRIKESQKYRAQRGMPEAEER